MEDKKRFFAARQFSYSGEARLWDEMYRQPKDVFEYHMLKRAEYALAYIRENYGRDSRILDLGCGAGILTQQLLEAGYRPTAVDMSDNMLELARNRCAGHLDKCEFVQADCTAMPFPGCDFDVVVSLGMFGYFSETDAALREIRRVLRPDGRVLISVRNRIHQIIFDPVLFIGQRGAKQRMRHGGVAPAGKSGGQSASNGGDAQVGPGNAPFVIDMFERPRYLISGVERNEFALEKFDGIGYGPLKLNERSILPERISLFFSRFAERLLRLTRLVHFSRWFADVSVYIFRVNRESAS